VLTSPFQWIEEVRSICGQDVPVILVGCKTDLRPPPGSPDSHLFVSAEKGKRIAAEIGARGYKECSALKSEGVDDVFEAATRASMLMREGTKYHDRREPAEEEQKGKCCLIC
jgi:GTPase SAR1 family protein